MPTDLTWHKINQKGQVLLGVKIKWHKCKKGYVNIGYGYGEIFTVAHTVTFPTTEEHFNMFILNEAAYQVSNPAIEVEPIWIK